MKTILIVDDDEKIGLALSVRLRAAGYEVLIARNGQEGLRLARTNSPDLVLLDIGLPLMDIWMPLGVGYSVARRLNPGGRGNIPIIFITASREKGLREAAIAVGAAGFFEKPYDAEELLSAIAKILHTTDPEGRDCHAPTELSHSQAHGSGVPRSGISLSPARTVQSPVTHEKNIDN